ncbi:hypothetical protein Tco_0769774 [Tanacetum coccineum]|uniref:Uncharacterized protein n=1 Tax=Tanacetum coccineum TaxID=301880 RepID=A0ABQ4ZDY4_9ASTR
MGSHTLQQLKRLSFDELMNLFEATMRRVGDFVPMETEIIKEVLELAAGSSKRDAEEELDQWSSKRQKTSENSEPAEESKEKEDDELSQEELQQLMIIDGIDIYMLVEKEYPLSRGVLTQMLAAKLLVEQNNEMSRELLRKIFMMAERPRSRSKSEFYMDRLPSRANLLIRGVEIASTQCVLCDLENEVESVEHCLFFAPKLSSSGKRYGVGGGLAQRRIHIFKI